MRSADPAGVRAPGGETVSEVAARMYAAMDGIANQFPEGAVLITSHGFALATVICKVKGMDLRQAYRVIPENADPVWVTWPVPG